MTRWPAVPAAVAAICVMAGLSGLPSPAVQAAAAAPVRAPDFHLPLLRGGTISRGAFAGKAAILLFWAPW